MTGPDQAVQAVRLAVRRSLPDERLPVESAEHERVLVACSGGADSLALVAATVFEARRRARDVPRPVVGVTVDHGLQEGSAARADAVVAQMAALGVDETMTIRVRVDAPGLGPEAAARQARYAALSQAADRSRARGVLLGHTLDDQAETVLLGLTRGSGGRSIAGMRRHFEQDGVLFMRPLLDVTRAQTEQACQAQGIAWWDDPHNTDPRFTRSRVRHRVMPVLERELGPGVAAALARTADLLQADAYALDEVAERVSHDVLDADGALDVVSLEPEPWAVLTRVVRRAALAAGCPPSELTKQHVDGIVQVMFGPAGRQLQLPGRLTASRDDSRRLRFHRT